MTVDHNANRLKTLRRSEMYAAMTLALDSINSGETIYLSSFQTENPLNQPENHELIAYHNHFFERVRSLGKQIEIRRLLAIQKIEKLPWLDTLINQFGDGSTNFNLRVYPTLQSWNTNGIPEPLPVQVQNIGGRVFVGAAREYSEQSDDQMFGIQIDPSPFPNSCVTHFFTKHHLALWEHAGADKRNNLIVQGHVNKQNVSHFKWKTCVGWLADQARQISSIDDLNEFAEEICSKLIPIQEWYLKCLGRREIRQAYERFPLTSEDRSISGHEDFRNVEKCEVMIAHWKNHEMCWPHDHGGASGAVFVLQGRARVTEYKYRASSRTLTKDSSLCRELQRGDSSIVDSHVIHAMESIDDEPLVTLHVYTPRPERIWIYDILGKRRLWIDRGGAFEPPDELAIQAQERCEYVEENTSKPNRSSKNKPSVAIKPGPKPKDLQRKHDEHINELWKGGRFNSKKELAVELEMTEANVKKAIDRFRKTGK